MLDAEEVADYEAWKANKIVSSQDISITRYNLEIETPALAWEEGLQAGIAGKSVEDNPYRKRGMAAYRKAPTAPETRRLST